MTIDARAILAAHNNADLYAAIFAAQGVPYRRTDAAFVGLDRPPPYYSDLVTLDPDLTEAAMDAFAGVTRRSNGRGGMKDSFACVSPRDLGLGTLFEACWIWHPPQKTEMPNGWRLVQSADALAQWEQAWQSDNPAGRHMFPAILLDHADLSFLGCWHRGQISAGCLVNRSAKCAGLSNVFGQSTYPEVVAAASRVAPDLPLTGYARDAELVRACAAGFSEIQSLRVLVPI